MYFIDVIKVHNHLALNKGLFWVSWMGLIQSVDSFLRWRKMHDMRAVSQEVLFGAK